MDKFKTHYDSRIGGITMIADGEVLLGLWFDGHTEDADDDNAVWTDDLPIFGLAFRWLDEYFAGRKPKVHVPIRLEGTPFREEIWALLREVPFRTVSLRTGWNRNVPTAARFRRGLSAVRCTTTRLAS